MIKLERQSKPKYLTPAKIKTLTDKFKADNSAIVWKSQSIGKGLLESSSYKCAYCECLLQIEDSYMQVEHFKDKDRYKDDVVNWDNLLPSCQRCNGKKGTLDVIADPIIDPFIDNPKHHLKQQAFRLYGKDSKGKTTVKKLFLNDDKRVVYPRFLASNEITSKLGDLFENKDDLTGLRNGIAQLLQSCQSDQPYSAFVSFALHSNPDYVDMKDTLEQNSLWDTDMNELHQKSYDLFLESR